MSALSPNASAGDLTLKTRGPLLSASKLLIVSLSTIRVGGSPRTELKKDAVRGEDIFQHDKSFVCNLHLFFAGLRTGSGRKADLLPLVGLGVESATGVLNPMKVVENPHTERPDWHEHLLAEVGQRIFDAGRFGRIHGTRNEAISLEAAKRERQHLLRDSTNGVT